MSMPKERLEKLAAVPDLSLSCHLVQAPEVHRPPFEHGASAQDRRGEESDVNADLQVARLNGWSDFRD